MKMRVLVATDGSEAASVGIDLAAGLAWEAGTTARVATAIDTGPAVFGGPWPSAALAVADDIIAALRAQADQAVEQAVGRLRGAGLSVDSAVIEGRPATTIVEDARRYGADVIIMGARGHGAIEEMVLGSVSAEVVDTSRIPVLIARRPEIRRILLGWDESPSAERAASLLETWPIFRGAEIRVVTVSQPEIAWWASIGSPAAPVVLPAYLEALDEARAARRRAAESMAARLKAAGLAADAEMREGRPAEELIAAGDAWGADLIAIGHARMGLARLALGSVARNVVHHARASVLVVRDLDGKGGRRAGS
jgi:nucleotide-binding universal stress UspA family protein